MTDLTKEDIKKFAHENIEYINNLTIFLNKYVNNDILTLPLDLNITGNLNIKKKLKSNECQISDLDVKGNCEINNLMATNISLTKNIDFLPIGTIIIWNGATNTIPQGWKLCNGANNTPNLSNRFIIGAGSNFSVNNTGGSKTVKLEISHLPSHKHTGNTSYSGNHKHLIRGGEYNHTFGPHYWTPSGMSCCGSSSKKITISEAPNHTHTCSTDKSGDSLSHNNLPPYYALCYIMRVI